MASFKTMPSFLFPTGKGKLVPTLCVSENYRTFAETNYKRYTYIK